MSHYSIDYETTSLCDIALGAYRYASDPSTRILMFAIAEGDGEPLIWDSVNPTSPESTAAHAMLLHATTSDSLIYAHSVMFELAISTYRLLADVGLEPPALDVWRCTRTLALHAGIPSSLANAAAFLGVTDKDKAGKMLINIFSDQSKIVTLAKGKHRMKVASPLLADPIPWDWSVTVAGESVTVADAWRMFLEYCRLDVKVEQEVHRKLAKFELQGMELEGFLFDLRMNHRGVPVNRLALEHAQQILNEEAQILTTEFQQITELQPSQTAKVLSWLQAEGYAADNLQSATMTQQLGSSFLSERGQRALEIRSSLSFAAIKKVPAMLATACDDDRMRGLLLFCGAQRTWRWTSSGPQLQNARKPTIKCAELAYEDLCSGVDRETLCQLYGNTYEVVASCIRNFIQPHDGEQMLCLDLSNIESRVACHLAGCNHILDRYRHGLDDYKHLASDVYGIPVDQITKDQRFVGKVGCLSLVFQVGAKTFHETCATWGMPIDKATAVRTVKVFRETRPEFPRTWRAYEAAMVKAINVPGEWHEATPFVSFARTTKHPFDRLLMRLPTGRSIVLPLPKVERRVQRHKDFETGEVREWETDVVSFYGSLRNHAGWGRVQTYAGDAFQTSVQAVARDIMLHGCLQAEKNGYQIFNLVHDEAHAHDGDLDGFIRSFTTLPPWLPEDFPLACEAERVPFYSKS